MGTAVAPAPASGPTGPAFDPNAYQLAASQQFAHLSGWIFDATWEPYTYAPGFGVVALPGLAAAQAFPITVESNAHFVICNSTMVVTDQAGPPANLVPAPLVQCQLQQSGSGRGFMPASTAVMIGNIFGTGQRPYIWPSAKLVQANSVFSVTLTNLTALALNLYLAFNGFAVMVTG